MKYAKMLGLLAVAAAAMMAFAASASASVATSPAGTPYTGKIAATNEGPLTLHGPADVTCNTSTVNGEIKEHGAAKTVKGPITGLTFTNCNQHVSVTSKGSLEAHTTANGQATLKSSGATVTVLMTTIFGNIHCNYQTNNTHIGTVTPAPNNSGHATLHIDSAPIPVHNSPGICGSSAEWTGAYKVNTPTGLRFS